VDAGDGDGGVTGFEEVVEDAIEGGMLSDHVTNVRHMKGLSREFVWILNVWRMTKDG
jgi:hypothetical protein